MVSNSAARFTLRAVLAVGGLLVLAFWWDSSNAGFLISPAAFTTRCGELAGLVAAYLVCVQVLLIARIPWFERAVGLDSLVSWHRTVGATTLLLVLTHVALMIFGQMLLAHQTPWDGYLAIFHDYPDMLTALLGTLLFLAVAASSIRALRRVLPYELWYWLHVTTYLAIFLTFLHQVSGGTDFANNRTHQLLWLALYLATAACVVAWRAVVPLRRSLRHRPRVVRVDEESPRMTSIWIEGRRLEQLNIRAGNFMLFRFLSPGHLLTAHPYSLSATPGSLIATSDDTGAHTVATVGRQLLRITVADLGNHSRALRQLRLGTGVLIEGPYGTFTAERAAGGPVLLIGGGGGIGPIRSLVGEFARRRRDTVLVFRASTADDLTLLDELQGLPVRVVPLVGRRSELGYDPLAPDALKRFVPDAGTREAFVCGPEGMTETVWESLRALGTPAHRIHAEELSFV